MVEAGLSAEMALKLVLILTAYRQLDLALGLLRAPESALAALPAAQRAELENLALSRPNAWVRLARRVLRRPGSDRRRALADAL